MSHKAIHHGLAAKSVIIIEGESREALQEVLDAAVQTHHPQNAWEAMLLDNAVSSAWRSRRAASYETAITNMQMQIDAPQLKKDFTVVDPITRQAISTRNLDRCAVSPRQLARYEADLSRSTHRWITILQQVQADRYDCQEAVAAVPQNEPSRPVTPTESEAPGPEPKPLPPQTATEIHRMDHTGKQDLSVTFNRGPRLCHE